MSSPKPNEQRPWQVTVEFGEKVTGLEVPNWEGVLAFARKLFAKILKPAEAEMAMGMLEERPRGFGEGFAAIAGASWCLRACVERPKEPFLPGDSLRPDTE